MSHCHSRQGHFPRYHRNREWHRFDHRHNASVRIKTVSPAVHGPHFHRLKKMFAYFIAQPIIYWFNDSSPQRWHQKAKLTNKMIREMDGSRAWLIVSGISRANAVRCELTEYREAKRGRRTFRRFVAQFLLAFAYCFVANDKSACIVTFRVRTFYVIWHFLSLNCYFDLILGYIDGFYRIS